MAHGMAKDENNRSRATGRSFERPDLESQPTIQLSPLDSARPSYDRNGTAIAGTTPSRWSTAGSRRTVQDGTASIQRRMTQNKHEQKVPTDNEYYTLNPWHDQPSEQPVFGLAQPLPRTVRKGMLRWENKKDRPEIYKVEDHRVKPHERDGHSKSHGFDHHQSGPDIQVQRQAQEPFETEVDGQRLRVRRVDGDEAEDVIRNQGIVGVGSKDTDEHGLQFDVKKEQPPRNTFGVQDGLPQLREATTRETAETNLKEQPEESTEAEKARQKFYNTYRNPLARFRAKYPQALAEFLSTFITLLLGLCGNLSVITSDNQQGGFITQAWSWGMAVMVGIYIGGGVSGAHLNPCISVCLSLFRGFPWRMCFVYIAAQFLAGFCAGGLAWFLYHNSIHHFDPMLTPEMTGKALYTLPKAWVSPTSAFLNEFVGSAVIVCIVFALGDDQNSPPGAGMNALVLGLANFLVVIALSYNTGPAISPARDFGPRLVALFAGYGTQTFTTGWWAYGPWGGGLSGSIVGAFLYDSMVFVGGESPVNYRWPRPEEIREKMGRKRREVRERGTRKLEV